MSVATAAEAPTREQNRPGYASSRPGGMISQHLLEDDAADGLNFRFVRNQFRPGEQAFRSPRHHHAFQQIRFAEKGDLNYAPGKFITEGDIAYFPRGAYYGPQLKDNGISIAIQFGFGGEHQHGPRWERYRAGARARLEERGTIKDGVYIEIDPVTKEKRTRDAVEALYEAQYAAHTNQKFVIPAEGYDAPILMHTKAFQYSDVAPGVEIKRLGRFYDHAGPNADVRISIVRLSGGSYVLGPDRAQLAWTIMAGLKVGDEVYPELACLHSKRDEEMTISGDDGVEAYIVDFPRLD
jgi:hypothetical protein